MPKCAEGGARDWQPLASCYCCCAPPLIFWHTANSTAIFQDFPTLLINQKKDPTTIKI